MGANRRQRWRRRRGAGRNERNDPKHICFLERRVAGVAGRCFVVAARRGRSAWDQRIVIGCDKLTFADAAARA